MKNNVVLLASMAFALVLVSGVALAITKNCTPAPDRCEGTNEPDLLIGSAQRDKIYGLAANDELRGNGGNDKLLGSKGADTMEGGDGQDTIAKARGGNDTIFGGPGADDLNDLLHTNSIYGDRGNDYIVGLTRLYGGDGDDFILAYHDFVTDPPITVRMTGGPGNDTFEAPGPGPDIVYARDGERDVVDCGPDEDTVYYDEGLDAVDKASCENLNPPQ